MKKSFGNGFILGIIVTCGIVSVCKFATDFVMSTTWGKTIKYQLIDTRENKLDLLKQYIDEYYIEDTNQEELNDGAYAGYIAALGDPYSTYYTKKENEDLMMKSEGEYCGIGVIVAQDPETKAISVVDVYDNTPAKKAGMKSEDILYKVADEFVDGKELDTVISKIKGEVGTTVKIIVYRQSEDKYIDMEVERAVITIPTIEYKMLDKDKKIGYIRILQFDGNTDEAFSSALEKLKNQGMKSVIFDVRNNPGGRYDTVCNMLDELLPEGTIVYTVDKHGNKQEEKSDARCLDMPMVVLINGNSASASEIFSGAIQDYKAGTIVGTQSFGKGIVQGVFELGDGTAIKLTTSKYYTPNGINIHGKGITPDVIVGEDGEELSNNTQSLDSQLDKALDLLK
ncbi:MAG: S41 family peptidase [Lachnospiraceae bacterium]|nr:S41 family peptidase [Lachnospiraceae bacterium]